VKLTSFLIYLFKHIDLLLKFSYWRLLEFFVQLQLSSILVYWYRFCNQVSLIRNFVLYSSFSNGAQWSLMPIRFAFKICALNQCLLWQISFSSITRFSFSYSNWDIVIHIKSLWSYLFVHFFNWVKRMSVHNWAITRALL